MTSKILPFLLSCLITSQGFAYGFGGIKTSVTDLSNASQKSYEDKIQAQQDFDNKVWSFLRDHHNIKSFKELFAFISENRQEFESERSEESFQFLQTAVNEGLPYNILPFENIDFDIRSVSEFFADKENHKDIRKGFLITMRVKTENCHRIDYSITLIVEKNKLEVLKGNKSYESTQQKIWQSTIPCFG